MDDPQMAELANAYGELVGMFGGAVVGAQNQNLDELDEDQEDEEEADDG